MDLDYDDIKIESDIRHSSPVSMKFLFTIASIENGHHIGVAATKQIISKLFVCILALCYSFHDNRSFLG